MHRTSLPLILVVWSISATVQLSIVFAAESLPKQSYLPLDLAQRAANAALKKCAEDGYRVSVTVVDRSGVSKAAIRADGAGPHTVSSSFRKAYTSASLGQSTQELVNTIKERPELEGLRNMDNQILILAGGLPIRIGDELVGGIGVGGAPGGHLTVDPRLGADFIQTGRP
jgi:uncharacterized protein GlcG (DUF336 family)